MADPNEDLVFVSLPIPAQAENPAIWRHAIEHDLSPALEGLGADLSGGGTYFDPDGDARTGEIFIYGSPGRPIFEAVVKCLAAHPSVPRDTTVALHIGEKGLEERTWTKA